MMSWQEKFNKNHEQKIKVLQKKFGKMLPDEKMLISTPESIYDFISNHMHVCNHMCVIICV